MHCLGVRDLFMSMHMDGWTGLKTVRGGRIWKLCEGNCDLLVWDIWWTGAARSVILAMSLLISVVYPFNVPRISFSV